jgi:hypothetical protein
MSTSSIIGPLTFAQTQLNNTSASSTSQQSAAKTLAQLLQDIESGNVSGAQKDLTTLNQQLGTSQSQSQSNSPLSTLLTSLNKDLGSGNISAAQSDVQNFFTSLENSSSATTAASDASNSTGNNSNSVSDPVKQDFLSLIQDVQSGNLQGAQSAYQKLTSLLSQNSDAQSSSSSTQSSSQSSDFQKLINNLGEALSSGNLTTAQQELQTYFQSGSQSNGTFVATSA